MAPPLDRVIRRCLAKDPDQRFQSARDLQYNLAPAMESPPSPVSTPPRSSKLPWIAAAVLALVAVLGVWAPWKSAPPAGTIVFINDEP